MARDCTICALSRLVAVSCASACFAALGVLALTNGLPIPHWVWVGFVVSSAVAFWVIRAYLRGRQAALTAEDANYGA